VVSVEDKWWIILQYLTFDHICEALTIIGFIYFVIQRFIRHKAPVPKSAFGTVSKELLERCVLLLQKQLFPSTGRFPDSLHGKQRGS